MIDALFGRNREYRVDGVIAKLEDKKKSANSEYLQGPSLIVRSRMYYHTVRIARDERDYCNDGYYCVPKGTNTNKKHKKSKTLIL